MSSKTRPISGDQRLVTNLVQNVMLERKLWLQRMLDPRRDLDYECGHPTVITIADYKRAFLRGDLATRVVSVWPEESWNGRPQVYETEDDTETEFESAWVDLEKRLKVYSTLLRADILSGIGRFGVVLLGLDDGQDLNQPVEGINERGEKVGNQERQLLYIRPFDESLITVSTFEKDTRNPRYGLPTRYRIQFDEPNDIGGGTSITGDVHWSRIIHITDNRTSSDVYGLPRMEKVFDRLLDVKKIAGGSGEMFWKGGFPGLSLEANPAGDEQIDFDLDATKEQLEAYMNGLQRYMATIGMQAKSLSVQVADPSPHLEVQIRLISMALGVPWRVFMGSEAAQLASEQDTRSWNGRLTRRREEYLTPYVITPFIERLVAFGVLPEPAELLVDWPDLNTPSDIEKADVSAKRTDALSKYVQGGVDVLIPPFHYLTLILGMEDDEARAIIEEMGAELMKVDEPQPTDVQRPAPARRNGNGR